MSRKILSQAFSSLLVPLKISAQYVSGKAHAFPSDTVQTCHEIASTLHSQALPRQVLAGRESLLRLFQKSPWLEHTCCHEDSVLGLVGSAVNLEGLATTELASSYVYAVDGCHA